DSMGPLAHLLAIATGLALMLHSTPSWAQMPSCSSPGCNPTASDLNGNTAGGTGALQNVCCDGCCFRNTAFGIFALSNNANEDNVAVGAMALSSNTTGGGNTATGSSALRSNTTGGGNTATGLFALFNNTTGNSNTASGSGALGSNTTGISNTAIGRDAL